MRHIKTFLTILLIICLFRSLNGVQGDFTFFQFMDTVERFQDTIKNQTTFGKVMKNLRDLSMGEPLEWDESKGFFKNITTNVKNIATSIRWFIGFLLHGVMQLSLDVLTVLYAIIQFVLELLGFVEWFDFEAGKHGGR